MVVVTVVTIYIILYFNDIKNGYKVTRVTLDTTDYITNTYIYLMLYFCLIYTYNSYNSYKIYYCIIVLYELYELYIL